MVVDDDDDDDDDDIFHFYTRECNMSIGYLKNFLNIIIICVYFGFCCKQLILTLSGV
jgi:hypothetical protein